MTEQLTPEDAKLVALARSARARIGAQQAAAVRDDTGRSYVGADVVLPSFQVNGLQLAVAQAVAAGAAGLEAGVVVTDQPDEEVIIAAVTDVGPSGVPVHITDPRGTVIRTVTT